MSEAQFMRAQAAAKRLLRKGEITKPDTCADCGGVFPARMLCVAHKDPTKVSEVHWLCRVCHGKHRRAYLGIVREDRHCRHCGKVIPHEGESDAEYEKRNYCDQLCYRAHRRSLRPKKVKRPPCAYCGEEVQRRPGENNTEYKRRKYCSAKCRTAGAAAVRWAKNREEKARLLATMRCEGCGGPIKAHEGESPNDLRKRKYCSVDCPHLIERRHSALADYNRNASRTSVERKAHKAKVKRLNEEAREHARTRVFTGFPDPRKKLEGEVVRMEPEFEVKRCSVHPHEALNAFGLCAACETSKRWSSRQREVIVRPSPEGGR